MNSTGALMIVVGIFIVGRLVVKDSRGQTLAGRLAGTKSSSSGGLSAYAPASSTAAPSGRPVLGSVTTGELASIGRRMGWNASQIKDWEAVITRESGGNPNATNASSGAYGIGQFLGSGGPASDRAKYYAYGGNPNTVMGQLVGMANYIKQRYGTPAGAWAHEVSAGWY